MAATKYNGLDATNDQPAKELTTSAPDFTVPASTIGAFPSRHNTVTAEVLARLLSGENLTGMEAVFRCSTTRLAATINYLSDVYAWEIDRVNIDVGTNDGRVVVVKSYFLNRTTIRKAFEAGALKYCRSVTNARARTRTQATKAKAEAAKRNAARFAAKFDPNQGSLFAGYANA